VSGHDPFAEAEDPKVNDQEKGCHEQRLGIGTEDSAKRAVEAIGDELERGETAERKVRTKRKNGGGKGARTLLSDISSACQLRTASPDTHPLLGHCRRHRRQPPYCPAFVTTMGFSPLSGG
jgi:hypothetical protein